MRIAVLLPAVAALIIGFTWRAIDVREARLAREQVRTLAEQAALRIEDFVQVRLLVVQSVTDEVSAGALVEHARFVSHTGALQAQLEGFLAINRVQADGTILWVSPPGPNRRAEGKNVLEHPEAGPVARRAFETRTVQVTPPLKLFQGMSGFASYFPVVDADGAFKGVINGVFDSRALVLRALRSGLLDKYSLSVQDEGHALFVSDGFDAASSPLAVEQRAQVFGRTWVITLRPTAETVADLRPGNHHAWALLGLFACLVLAALGVAWSRAAAQASLLGSEQARLQEELRQAQKMDALGRLAGGLAHDFNNLLTALRGHADLALSIEDLDEEARLGLEDILTVVDRGAEMTRGLLAFSRKQPDQTQRFDPGRRVRALQRTLRHLVGESIQQDFEFTKDQGVVQMDPTQLDQVVMNLVVNAVDAMPEGGRLGLRVRLDGEAWFVVEVEDTGVGIPEEVRQRIFEPFFTTKASSGTGLGLAQVWDFAHRAGGRVEVSSAPGEGTRVQVWLPRQEGRPDSESPPSSDAFPMGGRVLLVEDEPEVRDTVARLLRRSGYEVHEAGTVLEAWEIAIEGPNIDVLVSDVRLPDGTGPELGARLRERRPELPLIFCSGNARPVDIERIEALDAAFFTKPFSTEELVKEIVNLTCPPEGRLREDP